jgi:hypothetical protein
MYGTYSLRKNIENEFGWSMYNGKEYSTCKLKVTI